MEYNLQVLAQIAGVHLPHGVMIGSALAMDAQPGMMTSANGGIPQFLATYMDPKQIDVLLSPMKAAQIFGETKKGDWTTTDAVFPVIEPTGETSSYGDFNNNGRASVNANFPERQSYHYQVMTEWGERQLEIAGLAQIDWANRVNQASILTLNKYQNKTYFLGVAGLKNYGVLNDPALVAPIQPTNVGGVVKWSGKTPEQISNDVTALYTQLVKQTNGLIDMETAMTLVMSPNIQAAFANTNQFGLSARAKIKENFPNLKFETAPEYSTASGELLQLIVDNLNGQETVTCSFTEKLRAHTIVRETSSFKQKKSQGTWGAIIFRPFCIAQMLGV